MVYAVIVLGVALLGVSVLWALAFQKGKQLEQDLAAAHQEVDEVNQLLVESEGEVAELGDRNDHLSQKLEDSRSESAGLRTELNDTADSLRKKTELADAQASQIDSVSAERDDMKQQLVSAEEQIVTLAARPGVVVGETSEDSAATQTLWDLELARMQRVWRASVAINPITDKNPFDGSENPVQLAVETEAAALREDVGAHISVEWKAKPIDSAAKSLLVVRVAQEMLSAAARAPGAARFVVTQTSKGEIKMVFKPGDTDSEVINLIPPHIAGDLIDLTDKAGLSVIVKAV